MWTRPKASKVLCKPVSVSIPQCVGGNGHYAFRALLGGKARGILQSLIWQRGQMEARLVRVAEPGATGHCQYLSVRRDRQFLIHVMVIWSLKWQNITYPYRFKLNQFGDILAYFLCVLILCKRSSHIRLPVPASWLWRVWQVVTQGSVFWYLTSHPSLGPAQSSAAHRSEKGNQTHTETDY